MRCISVLPVPLLFLQGRHAQKFLYRILRVVDLHLLGAIVLVLDIHVAGLLVVVIFVFEVIASK